MKKNILIYVLIAITFIVLVQSVGYTKEYDPETKTVTILSGRTIIAEIQLLSSLDYHVRSGDDQLIAWFKLNNYFPQDGNVVFDTVTTNDSRNGSPRNKVMEYKIWNERTRTWQSFNRNNQLGYGTYYIGLFTDVEKEESIEWIPLMYGLIIDEWAVWTASLDSGLITWYDFNQTSVLGDIVFGTHNGTKVGSPTTGASGVINNAWEFSGTTQGVNITSITDFNFTGIGNYGNLTVSAWVNHDTSSADYIVDRSADGTSEWEFLVTSDNNASVTIYTSDGGNNILRGDKKIGLNEWVHIAFTTNGSDVLLYVNGTLDKKTAYDGTIKSTGVPIKVGFTDQGGGTQYFDGGIDEVGIWNRSLTSAEIADLYNTGAGINPGSVGVDVTLNFPTDNYISTDKSILFNSTVDSSVNLVNATFNIWYQNGTIFNSTSKGVTGLSNTTTLNITGFKINSYMWNVLACDSDTPTTCNSGDSNFSFVYGFDENAITFNASTIETSIEEFTLNISLIPSASLSSAIFYYNNTGYSSTKTTSGSNTIFNNQLDIPSTSSQTTKNFYWTLNIDGSLVNSSISTQTINTLNLGICNGVNLTTQVINFTSAYETNLTRISPFAFEGTFEYFTGSGETKKAVSIQDLSTPEVDICVEGDANGILLDAEIDYSFESQNVTLLGRKYFFDRAPLNNITQNISLYLLDPEDATTFILKVQDNTIQPVSGAYINILRYYPGEGIYRTVQVSKTDEVGRTVGFYQTETVTYKHIITKNGIVLLDTGTGGIVVGETVPFTLTFTVGESLNTPWSSLESNSSIITSLTYNATSNLTVFSYIDTTGSANFGRLLVYKQSNSNSTQTTICDTSTTGSSATIVCDMTGLTGTFIAEGYVVTSTYLQKVLTFIITTAREIFGNTGVIMGWLIILTVAMSALWNPSIGVILIDGSIILVGLTGLLVFSPIAYFSIIGISILLLVLFKT